MKVTSIVVSLRTSLKFVSVKGSTQLLFVFLLLLLGCGNQSEDKLRIAAAANMQYALDDMIKHFVAESHIPCELVYASSGKHSAQISEGAPFDLFLSANERYAQSLYEKGLCVDSPRVFAYGDLVLWTRDESLTKLDQLDLRDPQIKKIAYPNPKTAPFGEAAEEYLVNGGLYDQVKDKLVFAESVQQSNHFVNTRATQIGFSSASTSTAMKDVDDAKFITLDYNLYWPVKQTYVIVKTTESKQAQAAQFVHFLNSVKGQEILKKYAYRLVEKP